jgi:hypothetical protein
LRDWSQVQRERSRFLSDTLGNLVARSGALRDYSFELRATVARSIRSIHRQYPRRKKRD